MPTDSTRRSKPTGFWVLLIAILAAACIAGILLVHTHRQTGTLVQIIRDGQVEDTFPLSKSGEYRYETADGNYNIVVVKNGQVEVTEASCPDKICVRHGPTDQTADPIVCMPNRLVVQIITPDDDSQLDGVSS